MIRSALLAMGLLGVGIALALAAWPLRRQSLASRARWLVPMCVVILALPWLGPGGPVPIRAVVTLGCVGGLVPKLYDFLRNAPHWRDQTFLAWLKYVPNTLVLVEWRRRREPARPRANAVAWTARGLIEVTAGALLLRWAFGHDFGPGGFWLEHGVKLLACYLTVFDGGFVLATGLCRLVGFHVMDFSRDPALAPTPAAFWRRYNRDAGRFLHDHVFVPAGGLRRPVLGVFAVFFVNGLLHEYLATLMTGHVRGYQMAFFMLNAAAVALTFRLRPRRVGRRAGGVTRVVVGVVATLVFLYFSTMLFFATIDEIVPWYRSSAWPA